MADFLPFTAAATRRKPSFPQILEASQIGAVRVGDLDTNKHRTRAAMASVTALAVAPDGFTVADFAAQVRAHTGGEYTVRQAAYDLPKLRGKQLVVKPGWATATKCPSTLPAPSPA